MSRRQQQQRFLEEQEDRDPCGVYDRYGVYDQDIPWWYKSAVELIFVGKGVLDEPRLGMIEYKGRLSTTSPKAWCAWFKKNWRMVLASFFLLTLPIAAAVDYTNPARGVAGLVGFYAVCAFVLYIAIPFARSLWGGHM